MYSLYANQDVNCRYICPFCRFLSLHKTLYIFLFIQLAIEQRPFNSKKLLSTLIHYSMDVLPIMKDSYEIYFLFSLGRYVVYSSAVLFIPSLLHSKRKTFLFKGILYLKLCFFFKKILFL